MQTQTTNPSGNKAHIVFDVRKLVFTALLAAISSVLMLFSIKVPLMPSFISFDFSDFPAQTYPYLFDCDLLIIDDLGTELPNSFTVSQFFLCINERILRKKSTLISSNLDMEALRSIYSERTLSRIISSYTIRQLPGSDIRIKKKLYNTNS